MVEATDPSRLWLCSRGEGDIHQMEGIDASADAVDCIRSGMPATLRAVRWGGEKPQYRWRERALSVTQKLYTWGSHPRIESRKPMPLKGESFRSVAAGLGISAAVSNQGELSLWGESAGFTRESLASLERVDVDRVSIGASFLVALCTQGRLYVCPQADGYAWDVPLPAQGLVEARYEAVACGAHHVLALDSSGRVEAWGSNAYGQSVIPFALREQKVIAVDAASSHSLALSAQGELFAWGRNRWGQGSVPPRLASLKIVAISAGESHNLALDASHRVHAWGRNNKGQSRVPELVREEKIVAIAAGQKHNLALTFDGRVLAWGDAAQELLEVPTRLQAGQVKTLCAGPHQNLAIGARGELVVWGGGLFGEGRLPCGIDEQSIERVQAGSDYSLCLMKDGTMHAWGGVEVLAGVSLADSFSKVRVARCSGGYAEVCALSQCGKLYSLRDAQRTHATGGPWDLSGQNIVSVVAGEGGPFALTRGGRVLSRCGHSPLLDKMKVRSLDCGEHLVAASWEGEVLVWGGSEGVIRKAIPQPVLRSPIAAVSVQWNHYLALTQKGQVLAWSYDDLHPDFDEALTDEGPLWSEHPSPIRVISAGYDHHLALAEDGQVLASGGAGLGQGDVPDQLNLPNVQALELASGVYHNLVLAQIAYAVPSCSMYGFDSVSGRRWLHGGLGIKVYRASCSGELALGHVDGFSSLPAGQERPSWLDEKDIRQLAVGQAHVLALTVDDRIWQWGPGVIFRAADVLWDHANLPIQEVAAGGRYSLALTKCGEAILWWCVNGVWHSQMLWTHAAGTIVSISMDGEHARAKTQSGEVLSWL